MPDGEAGFRSLKGEYELRVEVMAVDAGDSVASVRAVVGGSVYGLMGTDALGRDLAEGLLFGLPVALLIGLAASFVSTVIGTTLGLVSGYLGGRWDNIIQRAADIVANVPVLPLLIFLVFIGGTQLWLILLVLVAFSWPGLTITVRSMALQIGPARRSRRRRRWEPPARGSSFGTSFRTRRRTSLHSSSFSLRRRSWPRRASASLALATRRFLRGGRFWSTVFAPAPSSSGCGGGSSRRALLIVLTAVTFMLLALGLEPAVDPRLRRSRSWRS